MIEFVVLKVDESSEGLWVDVFNVTLSTVVRIVKGMGIEVDFFEMTSGYRVGLKLIIILSFFNQMSILQRFP